jgi:hypothetical protein
MKVVGPGKCRDTTMVREFLFKNFVPFTWYDSANDPGKTIRNGLDNHKRSPVIETADHRVLINPSLRDLAQSAGIWRACPTEYVDLAVIGAGPAGMTAAIYAALTVWAPVARPPALPKSKTLSASPTASPALNWPCALLSKSHVVP